MTYGSVKLHSSTVLEFHRNWLENILAHEAGPIQEGIGACNSDVTCTISIGCLNKIEMLE